MHYGVRIIGCLMLATCGPSVLNAADQQNVKQKSAKEQSVDVAAMAEAVQQLQKELKAAKKKLTALSEIVMMNCADINVVKLLVNSSENHAHNCELCAQQSAQFQYQPYLYTNYQYVPAPLPLLTNSQQ